MKILETERLILRHQVLTDLDDLYALYCDPQIVQYIPDAPRSFEETREELEWHMHGHPRRPELGLWATIHKASGRFIGRCDLLPWTIEGRDEVEVAYLIAREFWRQGLATEAARGIVAYAFEKLHLERLVCMVDPRNIASQKVAEHIGMALEQAMEDELGPYLLYARGR